MPKSVIAAYNKAGITPPKGGKEIHPMRAHKAVIAYIKKGLSKDEAWKRVVGGMGKNAINPSHRRQKSY